jgi:hypothetical protein
MRTQIILLRIAGILCVPFVSFHFAFEKLFNWDTALNCLNQSDRSILLTYHYISILLLSFMAFVLLFQPKVILINSLKYSILLLFILFFIIRIITEFTLFKYSTGSPVILIMCGIPVILFSIPLFKNTKNQYV